MQAPPGPQQRSHVFLGHKVRGHMLDLLTKAGPIRAFLDALSGREGVRCSDAAVRRFYSERYIAQNPTLDADDSAWKAGIILDCCARAGMTGASSVLEVGCGAGRILREVGRALGARIAVGLDYGVSQASIAGSGLSLHALSGDGMMLPFRDESFDLVFLADVLEHVPDPVRALRELARAGTRVALLVPAERGVLADWLYATRRMRGKPTNFEAYGHVWRWTSPQVLDLVCQAGLSVLAVNVASPSWRDVPKTVFGRRVRAAHAATRARWPRLAQKIFGGVTVAVVARRSSKILS